MNEANRLTAWLRHSLMPRSRSSGVATVQLDDSWLIPDEGVVAPRSERTREMAIRRWLGLLALAVIVGMQAGTLFKPFGDVGSTRVADWIDLLTPFAIVGCAAMVLDRADADRTSWSVFGVGSVAFVLGHGLHLSANSISNVDQAAVAQASIVHLWDEVASHYIWYSGLFIVLVALVFALRDQASAVRPIGVVMAVAFAVTLVNTYIEGGVPWLGIAFLATGVIAGLAWRPAPVARLILLIGGVGLLLLLTWGAYWYVSDGTVFPEFSDVGWI
jgi:hypothetical protein